MEAGAHRDAAAAPAEGDAAVGGGAEVVDQGAAVGDALATGPADLLEQLGDRLGEDDVRGGNGEALAQRPPWGLRRGADGEHSGAGPHDAAGGVRLNAVLRANQPGHRRALADLDPRARSRSRNPQCQPCRLHCRRIGIERSLAKDRRRAALGNFRRRERLDRILNAELLASSERSGPNSIVRSAVETCKYPPPEPGIDPLALAELPDPRRGRLRRPCHRERPRIPPALPHIRQREPHHVAESPIPPTGSLPTSPSLQQNHPSLGLQLLDVPSRPHPGVATPDHNHIHAPLPHKLRTRLDPRRLFEPVPVRVMPHGEQCRRR